MKKRIVQIIIMLCISITAFAQAETSERIVFKHYTHNFGQLDFNEKAEYTFVFKNISDSTFVLTNVKAKCGCTSTEWTKEPVKEKRKGYITITYDTSITGKFSKSIIVFISGSPNPVKLLVTGTVNPPGPDNPEYENYLKKYPNHN